ncbi:MAG: 50S ribosomal protein L24e [Nitrososphaerota archaeon]|nr:50S ribosomal protein L24e [Nitrososphaerales archaeon]MDW8044355.1 50S ribosomal protein L24e [Nitrososphaerota archaeon]
MYGVRKCSFCGADIPLGRGIMFVKNDGSVRWYCSSKCRKNALELKRDPRKLKWTRFYKTEVKK